MHTTSGCNTNNYMNICFHPNSLQNSRVFIIQTKLNLFTKKQKISLKKNNDLKILLTNKQNTSAKPKWEQQTGTNTHRQTEMQYSQQEGKENVKCTFKRHSLTGNTRVQAKSHITSIQGVIPSTRYQSSLLYSDRPQINQYKSLTERQFVNKTYQGGQYQQVLINKKRSITHRISNPILIEDISLNNSFLPLEASRETQGDFLNQYRTVTSLCDSSKGRQRISESIVQIDFFNPSQERLSSLRDQTKITPFR